MNTKDFLYFKIIVDESSISKAANRIGVSQPYLSGFLTSLENKLGTKLIERNYKPPKLTDDGILFYSTATKIVNEEEFLKNALSTKKSKTNRIRIGVGPTRAKYLIDRTILDYLKKSPKNVVELKEIINEEAYKTILNNETDIVIHYGKIDELQSIRLFNESLQFVALKETMDRYKSFEEMPLIVLHKSQIIREKCNPFIKEKNIVLECNNIDTALYYVEKGIGATVVPDYVAKSLNKELFETRPLDECEKREVFVSFKDRKYLPSYTDKFIEELIKTIGEGK